MAITDETMSLLFGAAVVLAVSFIVLNLSAAIDRLVDNIAGKKSVD